MKTYSSYNWLRQSPISRCPAVMLVVLAWSTLGFCGEIHSAVAAGDLEKVKTLLKADPNLVLSKDAKTNDWTPLHFAAFYGQKEVAGVLLTNKANVEIRDNTGFTPLLVAVYRGRTNVVRVLLAAKAEVNVKDPGGWTPLHWAVFQGWTGVVELLVANKADVNAKNDAGNTPLHLAADKGLKEMVELLRKHGGHE
jgi:ankyrin repeat protein